MSFLKVLKDISTTADGATFDNIRISSTVAVIALICLSAANLYAQRTFDALAFGGGVATVLAATGAAINLKKKDEPDA